jgi:hypothetical protein
MKWREKGQNRTRKVCRFKEKKGSVTAKLILSRGIPAEFLDTPVECGHSLLQQEEK